MGCAPSSSKNTDGPPLDAEGIKFVVSGPSPDEDRARAEAAQLKLKNKSAAKMQSVVRGKAARDRVELIKHACFNYRVNIKAHNFGDCQCGWPKADHTDAALQCQPIKKEAAFLSPTALRERFVQKEMTRCTMYMVNMNAQNFGECICGVAKAAHTKEALAAADKAKANTAVDSEEVRKRFVQREKVECTKFGVNMNAQRTAECFCGALRAEHTDAALQIETASNKAKAVNSAEVRLRFVQKTCVECDEFELDMDPCAAFGTCKCGESKAMHSESAFVRLPSRRSTAVVATGSA